MITFSSTLSVSWQSYSRKIRELLMPHCLLIKVFSKFVPLLTLFSIFHAKTLVKLYPRQGFECRLYISLSSRASKVSSRLSQMYKSWSSTVGWFCLPSQIWQGQKVHRFKLRAVNNLFSVNFQTSQKCFASSSHRIWSRELVKTNGNVWSLPSSIRTLERPKRTQNWPFWKLFKNGRLLDPPFSMWNRRRTPHYLKIL